MRWGLKRKKRILRRRANWSRWFAWHPVKLTAFQWCWLEWLERRDVNDWMLRPNWIYRTPDTRGQER